MSFEKQLESTIITGKGDPYPQITPFSIKVMAPLFKQDITHGNRQHHSSCLNKQGRRHEVGPTVCPAVEDTGLVFQKTSYPQGLTLSRQSECGSRQDIQARPDHPEWSLLLEVFQLICNRWHQPQIDLFPTRFNNKLPQFVSTVPDPLTWAVNVKVVAKLRNCAGESF